MTTPNVYFNSHANAGKFCLALKWVNAIYAHDFGEFEELERLILSGESLPEELRGVIASAISRKRYQRSRKGGYRKSGHA